MLIPSPLTWTTPLKQTSADADFALPVNRRGKYAVAYSVAHTYTPPHDEPYDRPPVIEVDGSIPTIALSEVPWGYEVTERHYRAPLTTLPPEDPGSPEASPRNNAGNLAALAAATSARDDLEDDIATAAGVLSDAESATADALDDYRNGLGELEDTRQEWNTSESALFGTFIVWENLVSAGLAYDESGGYTAAGQAARDAIVAARTAKNAKYLAYSDKYDTVKVGLRFLWQTAIETERAARLDYYTKKGNQLTLAEFLVTVAQSKVDSWPTGGPFLEYQAFAATAPCGSFTWSHESISPPIGAYYGEEGYDGPPPDPDHPIEVVRTVTDESGTLDRAGEFMLGDMDRMPRPDCSPFFAYYSEISAEMTDDSAAILAKDGVFTEATPAGIEVTPDEETGLFTEPLPIPSHYVGAPRKLPRVDVTVRYLGSEATKGGFPVYRIASETPRRFLRETAGEVAGEVPPGKAYSGAQTYSRELETTPEGGPANLDEGFFMGTLNYANNLSSDARRGGPSTLDNYGRRTLNFPTVLAERAVRLESPTVAVLPVGLRFTLSDEFTTSELTAVVDGFLSRRWTVLNPVDPDHPPFPLFANYRFGLNGLTATSFVYPEGDDYPSPDLTNVDFYNVSPIHPFSIAGRYLSAGETAYSRRRCGYRLTVATPFPGHGKAEYLVTGRLLLRRTNLDTGETTDETEGFSVTMPADSDPDSDYETDPANNHPHFGPWNELEDASEGNFRLEILGVEVDDTGDARLTGVWPSPLGVFLGYMEPGDAVGQWKPPLGVLED